jgi:hypothetical protein
MRLPRTWGSIEAGASARKSTRPPITSAYAPVTPLYGTCVKLTCATTASSSTTMWVSVPVPLEPKVSFPGFAFAAATRSAIVACLDSAAAPKTSGDTANAAIGARSFCVS